MIMTEFGPEYIREQEYAPVNYNTIDRSFIEYEEDNVNYNRRCDYLFCKYCLIFILLLVLTLILSFIISSILLSAL